MDCGMIWNDFPENPKGSQRLAGGRAAHPRFRAEREMASRQGCQRWHHCRDANQCPTEIRGCAARPLANRFQASGLDHIEVKHKTGMLLCTRSVARVSSSANTHNKRANSAA